VAVVLAWTLLTVAATLVGGILALRLQCAIDAAVAFAAGIVIAAATLDLLPEAIERGGSAGRVGALFLAGILWFFGIGRLMARHERHASEAPLGAIEAAMLCIHSFQDGLAIGLAFSLGHAVGIVVLAAVVTHDLTDGLNTVTFVLAHRGSRRAARAWLIVDSLAPLAGAAVSVSARLPASALGQALAVFAGIFLMIGVAELLPRAHRHLSLPRVLLTFAGVALMAVVTAVVG
jgi:zinc transporter, ZIP family